MTSIIRPADLKGVPIAWSDSPFGAFGGRVFRGHGPAGGTIAEIVASVPALPDSFAARGAVCINGDPVPRSLWRYVRPKPANEFAPVVVTLHMPLRGGGGAGGGSAGRKNTFALIASIALLAATVAISGGLLAPFLGSAFAAGHLGATLLATGVSLAGSLLIAALTPPPIIAGAQQNDESKGSASADGNVIEIGGPLPRVCGTFRVFPPPIVQPVIEIIGDDEYVTQTYALAGPHALSDIRLGDGSIDDNTDITSETREGWVSDPPLTLNTRQAVNVIPQAELSTFVMDQPNTTDGYGRVDDQADPSSTAPAWQTLASRIGPDEVWVHLYFPTGIGAAAGGTDCAIPFRMRIRRRGDANWINLPEIHCTDRRANLVRRAIVLKWATAPTVPAPPSQFGWYLAFARTVEASYSQGGATLPTPPAWVAHQMFNTSAGDIYLGTSNTGTTGVRNTLLYNDRVEFYLDPAIIPQDAVIEVQIKRGAPYTNSMLSPAGYSWTVGFPWTASSALNPFWIFVDGSNVYYAMNASSTKTDKVIVARLCSIWNQSPAPRTGIASLTLQAKNLALSQVSALASGYVRDWNGDTWSEWTTSSNPALHFRDVLAGSLTSRLVPAVNDDRLVEWRDRCDDAGFAFDAILSGRSMGEALSLLASAGFARPRKSESWGVIIDQDRSADTPAQIFNPRNLAGFRMEKAFADLPDGFVVTYRDSDLDYQQNQVVVYRNGFGGGNAKRLEAVDYIGPVTEAAAVARGTFDLAQAEARSTFYYGDADIEAIVTEAGDLVAVQHDILEHTAGFTYLKEVVTSGGNVTGFRLDSKIPLTLPDDVFAVDEFFGLNNVFGCIRGLDFIELADVFTTSDVFADGTAGAGLAIRCRDGSILTKAITAEAAEDDDITVVTPFADPGSSILAAGCLAHSGPLGREYRRLILREAVPGKDLTAALTFIDEANELWRAAA